MAVTLTSNISLFKPDETEIAENWANFTALQAANNTTIENKSNVVLTSYTPTVIATTTAPTFGAGGTRGEYCNVQNFIFGNFIIEFINPGLTAGSGEYGISLPAPVDGTFHTVGTSLVASGSNVTGALSVIGEGYAYDNSNVTASGSFALDCVTIAGTSYVRMVTEAYTIPGKTSSVISSGQIFVPDDGDRFTGQFFYKRT